MNFSFFSQGHGCFRRVFISMMKLQKPHHMYQLMHQHIDQKRHQLNGRMRSNGSDNGRILKADRIQTEPAGPQRYIGFLTFIFHHLGKRSVHQLMRCQIPGRSDIIPFSAIDWMKVCSSCSPDPHRSQRPVSLFPAQMDRKTGLLVVPWSPDKNSWTFTQILCYCSNLVENKIHYKFFEGGDFFEQCYQKEA